VIFRRDRMGYRIGLDIGIASIGYSILKTDENGNPKKIEFLNSVIFPIAENPKDGSSLAAPRREKRGLRRRNRRKNFRKYRTKRLFIESELLTEKGIRTIFENIADKSIYQLRSEALDKLLTNEELFRVFYFFSGHRGFKSNRKAELKDSDNGPVLTAISETKKALHTTGYRTLGEYYYKDSKFDEHKRNKEHEYLTTPERSLLVEEIKEIISKQRGYGNEKLTEKFEEAFIGNQSDKGIFNQQRDFDEGPGENSPYAGDQIEKMIGWCTFEKEEKRAPKASYTFQYFDLLSTVNNLRIQEYAGESYRNLIVEERQLLIDKAFEKEKITYKDVKKLLNLDEYAKFNLLNYGSKIEAEATEKKTTFVSLKAYHKLKKTVGKEVFSEMSPVVIDEFAYILTAFSSDNSRMREFKNRLDLSNELVETLLSITFSKFGNLSIKAMKKVIPYLELGDTYDKACGEAGYDFRQNHINEEYIKENVANPVVKRAVSKTIKVVKQIISKYGPPDAINIELARELGKSNEERNKIKKRQDENRSYNEKVASQISELGFAVNGESIIRLKLWFEQKNLDPYTGLSIPLDDVFSYKYDVDHIIPYSKSFDDQFTNKVLTSTACNREKGNRIPMEYLGNNPIRVKSLEAVANQIKNIKKREKLLKQTFSKEDTDGFKERNLKDTQYISKLLKSYFEQNIIFSESLEQKQKVFVGNGVVTARLRARWGLNKVRDDGDKHHAMDATVVACMTPTLIRMLTLYSRRQEVRANLDLWQTYDEKEDPDFLKLSKIKREQYESLFSKRFPEPWPGFRDELLIRMSEDPKSLIKNYPTVKANYSEQEIMDLKPMFVVRLANHKITGPAHQETIRSAKLLDEGKTVSRMSVDKLKLDKNGEIKTAKWEFYQPSDNGWKIVYEAIRRELEKNDGDGTKAFPEKEFTYEFNGHSHTVRKVQVVQKTTLSVQLNDGEQVADNGSMVRIDVFKTAKKYVFVPIYVSDTIKNELPNKACVAHKPYKDWPEVDEAEFQFSLYPRDMLHIKHKTGFTAFYNGENKGPSKISDFYGYFTAADIANAQINIVSHDNSFLGKGIGIAGLEKIEKYAVDYFGNYHKVNEKVRQAFQRKKG